MVPKENGNYFDKSRFYIAQSYLQTALNLFDGMISSGNPYVTISDHEISEYEHQEHTRFSSQNTMLPALLCLYQGIELILKGFVLYKEPLHAKHNADKLCAAFEKLYPDEKPLAMLFRRFIFSPYEFIKKYMGENQITKIGDFYNSLRYPDKCDGSIYRYWQLTHFSLLGTNISHINEIKKDVDNLRILSVKLFRWLDDNLPSK